MSNTSIPDEAVEALARVLAGEALFNADIAGTGWDAETDSSDHFMPNARKRAIEYLEAAAPHMLAGYVEAKPPEHQCEPWQLQANGRVAFRACSACGENQE